MSKLQRGFLKLLAGLGWGSAAAITVGSLFIEFIHDHDFFFGRLFSLLALVGAVVTLGLWYEGARRRHTTPVQTAFDLGVQFGINLSKYTAPDDARSLSSLPDEFWNQPIDPHGPQDTPPYARRRR